MQQRKVEGSGVHSGHDRATFVLFCDTIDYAICQDVVATGKCLPATPCLREPCQLPIKHDHWPAAARQ